MTVFVFLAAASTSAVDLSIAYKDCVEKFAFDNIRSGESAEVLFEAGASECDGKIKPLRAAIDADVFGSDATKDALKTLPRDEVVALARDSADRQFEMFMARTRKAALRNIVVVKAQIAELESSR